MLRCRKFLLAFAIMIAVPGVAAAQATDGKPPEPEQTLLKPEQLDALVAPIALYPDELLANVLAASTYPLEAVQADRWVKANKNLKGDALKTAVEKQAWDDSIKALAATPDVLAMMSDKIDWTKNLGDAVLAQQPDVMDAIQRLRALAHAHNKLVTDKQQKVSVQRQENKEVIVIEQAQPDTVYVPYYDPATVYGEWPYAEYPPYYFGYPSYIGAGVIAAGLAFGTGWAIGRWGNYWGGGANWGSRNLYVNHYNRTTNIGNNWQHNPAHRQGVRYSNTSVQQKFGNNNLRSGAADRMDYRGRDGQKVLDAGKDRAGAGDRAGDRAGADRAGAGDRAKAGDGAKGGDRAKGGGDRAKTADRSRAAGAGNKGGGRDTAIRNVSSGRAANVQSARGQASIASARVSHASMGGGRGGGGGAAFAGGGRGGGGFGGGGGGRGGGGGGRRSDIALKHDIVLLGKLDNGLGYYRFSYLGSDKAYVGVMAQEVQSVMPDAVTRGGDGYLRVHYDRLGNQVPHLQGLARCRRADPHPREDVTMTKHRLAQSCFQYATALLAAVALLLGISSANAQQIFKTPEEAATALAAAVKSGDTRDVLKVLGRDGVDIMFSGDEVADREARERFVGAYDAKHSVTVEGDKAILVVGADDFPLPIPLVRQQANWKFDTAAGRLEVLYRRIGRNELDAIFKPASPMSMPRTNMRKRTVPGPDLASMHGASSAPPARRTASIGRRRVERRARLANSSPRPLTRDTERAQAARHTTATTIAF